jgi:hypothetical protein
MTRDVTAESRVLARMLAAHEGHGVTHALVSDSFFMEVAAAALPAWTTLDRARFFTTASPVRSPLWLVHEVDRARRDGGRGRSLRYRERGG